MNLEIMTQTEGIIKQIKVSLSHQTFNIDYLFIINFTYMEIKHF